MIYLSDIFAWSSTKHSWQNISPNRCCYAAFLVASFTKKLLLSKDCQDISLKQNL